MLIEHHNILLENTTAVSFTLLGMLFGAIASHSIRRLFHLDDIPFWNPSLLIPGIAAFIWCASAASLNKFDYENPRVANYDEPFLQLDGDRIRGTVKWNDSEFVVWTSDPNIINAYKQNPKSIFVHCRFQCRYLLVNTQKPSPSALEYYFFVDSPK